MNLGGKLNEEDNNSAADFASSEQRDFSAKSLVKRVQEENAVLRASLKESQKTLAELSTLKDNEIRTLKQSVKDLRQTIDSLHKQIETLERSEASGEKHIRLLQKALKSNITSNGETIDDLLTEIDKITDSQALLVINKLVSTDRTKGRKTVSNFPQDTLSRLEKEDQKQKFETLQTQNNFLLNQLAFLEKQLDQQNKKPAGRRNEEDERSFEAACRLLGIKDRSRAMESAIKIQKALSQVPSLQKALEEIYMTVIERSCIPVSCDSQAELLEALENWAGNLRDYQQLVQDLFEILQIEDERFKNRTHLVESIRDLARGDNARLKAALRERVPAQNDTDPLRKQQKLSSTVEFFLEEARKRLHLSPDYSSQALFSKILKILDENSSANENRDISVKDDSIANLNN